MKDQQRNTTPLSRTSIRFPLLPEGISYRFVSATPATFFWCLLADVSFIESRVFFWLLLLAFLFFGVALYFYNVSKINREKIELEEKVAKRTAEISKQKNEIQSAYNRLNKTYEQLQLAYNQLQSMQLQLVQAEKMASLGQLTAGIAHELNNPINFVKAGIDPLRANLHEVERLVQRIDDFEPEKTDTEVLVGQLKSFNSDVILEELDSILMAIEEGANRAKEIIVGLKTFSRSGETHFSPADIHKGLDSTLMLLKSKMKSRIIVEKDYGELPMIECLPGKLNQVFMNILTNAIEAIEGQGTISIHTRSNDQIAIIEIEDDGIGMPEDVKRQIFEPFFTTKEFGYGTGLGLSISFGIIETHKGSLKVESAVNQGTTFTIKLPIRQAN
ncbi:MAG: ATP-binding protein [Bacteroidota bacterium]